MSRKQVEENGNSYRLKRVPKWNYEILFRRPESNYLWC